MKAFVFIVSILVAIIIGIFALIKYEKNIFSFPHSQPSHTEIEFGPTFQTFYEESSQSNNAIKPIICKANRPTDLTIFKIKSTFDSPTAPKLPSGASLIKGKNEVRVVFNQKISGDCYNGTYVCSATDASGVRHMKMVHLKYTSSKPELGPKMKFNLESRMQHITEEEIAVPVGASINISCSFRDEDWRLSFLFQPFVTFYSFDLAGRLKLVKEISNGQTKIVWDSFTTTKKLPAGHIEGSRTMHILNIARYNSKTYVCQVFKPRSKCRTFKSLKINVV